MKPRATRTLPRWVAVAGATLLALAAAEGFVRWRFADEVDTARLQQEANQILIAPFTRRSADPELGFELLPGTDIEWHGTRVRIHPTEARRIPPDWTADGDGELRLAVVGDSTGFGWGVEYAQSYPALVRRTLEERTGRRVELRNWCTPGYNARQNRRTYQERVRAWRPHLLLVHYDFNDAAPNTTSAEGTMAPTFGDNALGSALVKLARRRFGKQASQDASSATDAGDANILGFRYAGPDYERHLEELRSLARLAREDGVVPLLLVFNAGIGREDPDDDWTWPTTAAELTRMQADRKHFARMARSRGFRDVLHARLANQATAMGFEVVDTYAPVQELLRARDWPNLRSFWISKDDNHPDPAGHAFLAELVIEAFGTREPYRALLGASERR